MAASCHLGFCKTKVAPLRWPFPKPGASIPIYRWRQMRHGQFLEGDEKSILWGNEKV